MVLTTAILDASAVLALLFDEPGCANLEQFVGAGCLSVVNYSEVAARLSERGAPRELIDDQIAALSLALLPFDRETALAAGLLRPATKAFGLSFGDRACLATAGKYNLPAVTSDHDWAGLDIGITIELFR